ncbi:MAG: hypothetical protein Q9193_003775 [Seirophora villosa]
MLFSPLATALLLLPATLVVGHGAPETVAEIAFREAHHEKAKCSLGACSQRLRKRDTVEKRFAKTDAFIEKHRRGQTLGEQHSTAVLKGDFITSGLNSTCILTPEAEEGPYYVDSMLIRQDIREDQVGVDLLLDIQITNVNTCKPMSGVYVDFWNANSTGVYSDKADENTVGLTYLRGLQASDSNGVVEGGSVVHTGQLFFAQSTLDVVNALYPYTEVPNTITLNTVDQVIQQQANAS